MALMMHRVEAMVPCTRVRVEQDHSGLRNFIQHGDNPEAVLILEDEIVGAIVKGLGAEALSRRVFEWVQEVHAYRGGCYA